MKNGQVILDALNKIGEPATCESVVAFIAKAAQVQPETIKKAVADTLEGGVKYGFIQQLTPGEESESASDNESDDEVQDRSRRGRSGGKKRRGKRGGGRRRRSSRSRSKRSRSRRRKH